MPESCPRVSLAWRLAGVAFSALLLAALPACGDDATSATSATTSSTTSVSSGGNGGSGGATSTSSSTSTNATTGSGGTTSTNATTGSGGAPQSLCPPGSEALVLDLAAASPSVVAGVPPADNYSPGFSILEGPVWLGDKLLLSQISTNGQPPAARILAVVPGSPATVFLDAAGTNGLALDLENKLFGAVHKDGSISRFDLDNPSAAPVVVAGKYLGARFNSPNDLALRADGNLYFTDPDWQSPKPAPQSAERAYRVAPGGEITPFGEYDDNGSIQSVQKPNGVILRLDETALYLGGTNGLFRFPLDDSGAVGVGARVTSVNGSIDGLARDCAGNLYVAIGSGVTVLGPTDAVLGSITIPLQVTNMAFGDADRKTLYVTTLGGDPKLYRVQLNVPGLPY